MPGYFSLSGVHGDSVNVTHVHIFLLQGDCSQDFRKVCPRCEHLVACHAHMIVGRTQFAHSACGAKPAPTSAQLRRTTLALAVRRCTRPACPTRTNMSLGCNAEPGVLLSYDSCNFVMLLLEQVGVYARAFPRLYGGVSRGMATPGAYQVFQFLLAFQSFQTFG